MNPLQAALEDPATGPARLRELLVHELKRGETELKSKRSGYDEPVCVAFAPGLAALPIPADLRADATATDDRAWRLVAATVLALQTAAELPAPARAGDLELQAGETGGFLTIALGDGDPELAQLAFDEAVAGVDRLRAHALVVPDLQPHDLREPIGAAHPLKVAEAVARLGGDPTDPQSVEQLEDAVYGLLEVQRGRTRPHDDPDPATRVARRILQRLDGMGKWGGFHTDFAHLARGFAGNDRQLADEVGEALIQADLLIEKPSVGQRHVFLNPRKAGEIRRLIDDGTVPAGLRLPRT
ncbi:MAG: hypothetical protein AVDCRST_MAG85-3636 [uncultured Solirubrobacteraceae bacterium]|uniref:Uncharacterized protein n=1 Tax=uncultured Solirubrobacteraceae bacterium TaxID=1162706 RepID=A0A6J4TTC3_9ACTN|nr:MAG: hypothetical protein AVDCRST_MAG85-3636 [uncultured Solirubrobacteraceae bacterium]